MKRIIYKIHKFDLLPFSKWLPPHVILWIIYFTARSINITRTLPSSFNDCKFIAFLFLSSFRAFPVLMFNTLHSLWPWNPLFSSSVGSFLSFGLSPPHACNSSVYPCCLRFTCAFSLITCAFFISIWRKQLVINFFPNQSTASSSQFLTFWAFKYFSYNKFVIRINMCIQMLLSHLSNSSCMCAAPLCCQCLPFILKTMFTSLFYEYGVHL